LTIKTQEQVHFLGEIPSFQIGLFWWGL